MGAGTKEFFDNLAQRGHEPLLGRATGTVRFDLQDGKQTEHWLVTLDKGDIAVSQKNAAADCVVQMSQALFDGVARGEVNAMAALLRGALQIEGDLELLLMFQRLLPGPPSSRADRHAAGYARRQT